MENSGLRETMTLAAFKKAHGVEKLTFKQYGGRTDKRHFATLPDGTKVFMARELNDDEPMFVSVGKYDAFWLHNLSK